MKRIRISTLMLLIVIAALVVAWAIEHRRSAELAEAASRNYNDGVRAALDAEVLRRRVDSLEAHVQSLRMEKDIMARDAQRLRDEAVALKYRLNPPEPEGPDAEAAPIAPGSRDQ